MSRPPVVLRFGLICLFVLTLVGQYSAQLGAETINIDHGYHWQQTNYYCGIASIQMMLDTPAVRNNNPAVDAYFTNHAGNDVLIQNQIYLASRHRLNQFYPVGYRPGTDPVVFSYTINAYDGIPNGPALPGGVAQGANTNNHAYGWYGFLPTEYAAHQASRTVAYALKNYDVPATVAVGHGAHWVVVDGVTTLGDVPTPANPNSQFQITGFFVSDPWTGYAQNNPAQATPPGKQDPILGLGAHAWYRYGFNATFTGSHGEEFDEFDRRGAWFNYFNPVGPGPYPFSGQYNIVVEPEPSAPFPADSGEFESYPDPYAILSSPVTSGDAQSYVLDALAGDFAFLDENFTGGSWDTSNVSLFSYPDDPSGIGDWLVPYLGPGGADDVRGAAMIDSLSGTVNQAMWFPEDMSFTYDQLADYYSALYVLDIPLTILPVPEPTTGGLMLLALALLTLRRSGPMACNRTQRPETL
jgi:hypothetical protein